MTPEEATRALPSRPTSRRASLAQAAQRSVSAGAVAYSRTGNPEDFANAVVGDLNDRHLRALGRLGESDLRASLAQQGITGERADVAIDCVKTKISGKFQRVVRERGQEALESAALRLRAAADPGSAECARVSEARETEAAGDHHIKVFILAAGAVLGVMSGGVGSAMVIAGMSATARGGMTVQRAWAESHQTTGRALAGLATSTEANHARTSAMNTTAISGGAVVLDVTLAGRVAAGHHWVRQEASEGARVAVDVGAALVDGALAYAVEQGAHTLTAAVNGEDH